MPKVSVIVPAYNVEAYIETCINSILNQTLQDLEIVCVDDGSRDRTPELLDAFAQKDARIRVLHRENSGYGVSMNAGLHAARGEYIGIVESDDYILPDMFETLYQAAVQKDLDMVKSEAYYWLEKENLHSRIHNKVLDPCFDRVLDEWDKNLFFEFYMNIWTGLYKKSFLMDNRIRFHETPGASYQDNGFWFLTCVYAKRAMWLNRAFYYYRQDNPAASIRDKGKMMAMEREYEYIEDQLRQRGLQEYLPYCYRYRIIRNLGTYFRIADEEKKGYCPFLQKEYARYMPYIVNSAYYNRRFGTLLREPEKTTDWILEKKRSAVQKMERAKSIVIYGAAGFAEKIFRVIASEGYAGKVACFAVTQNGAGEKLANRDIILLEKAILSMPEALYVIAVSSHTKAYAEMADNLVKAGIGFVLDGNDLEEFFYVF